MPGKLAEHNCDFVLSLNFGHCLSTQRDVLHLIGDRASVLFTVSPKNSISRHWICSVLLLGSNLANASCWNGCHRLSLPRLCSTVSVVQRYYCRVLKRWRLKHVNADRLLHVHPLRDLVRLA